MENPTYRMTVTELTEAIIPLLKSENFSRTYVKTIGYTLNQLLKFCENKGENRFNVELGQRFIEEHYNVTPETNPRNISTARRVMDMLSSYQQVGIIFPRRRKHYIFPDQFVKQINDYYADMHRNFASDSTIKRHTISLRRLTLFLDGENVRSVSDITRESLNDYIKIVLCNFGKGTLLTELGILRHFLGFLYTNGDLPVNLSASLPKHRLSRIPSNLPSTFTPEEVGRILASVDRSSPLGKRNYAVLMLAAKLGLRTCDIKNLKPENIDWENRAIHLTQVKTNEPLTLPLPSDVGWSLIDYIRYGRPVSEAPEIFIRVCAPYESLRSFDHILVKAMRHAKIPFNRTTHHGLHTLRHSFATEMLGQNTPIYVIQEVLGHVDAHTTKRYTSIDIGQLRTCALEVNPL
jgi:site-specific recombinase XerD